MAVKPCLSWAGYLLMVGRLYAMKVTPPHGKPYFLIDNNGDGQMVRRDSLDPGLRVPQWVIRTF